jgi:hypothetical protein
VAKHYRLSVAPVLVVDLRAVFGFNCAHLFSLRELTNLGSTPATFGGSQLVLSDTGLRVIRDCSDVNVHSMLFSFYLAPEPWLNLDQLPSRWLGTHELLWKKLLPADEFT